MSKTMKTSPVATIRRAAEQLDVMTDDRNRAARRLLLALANSLEVGPSYTVAPFAHDFDDVLSTCVCSACGGSHDARETCFRLEK